MNIVICKTAEDAARSAAVLFAGQVIQKPNSILGLATGGTAVPVYSELIKMYKDGTINFSDVITFNLDEYVGLPRTNEQSYYYFMHDNLFNHVNINPENVHLPDGMAADLEAECLAYENAINTAGGIDMQLLGIGHNGHIAFNEPSDQFTDITNVVSLKESTIEANKRFFENADMVPRRAISVGIGTIMRARKIVMVITGEGKSDITRSLLTGAITPNLPASALKLRENVTVIIDEAAASKLN